MKKVFSLTLIMLFISLTQALGQNVGIGTNTPLARFHVIDSSVIFSATGNVPVAPGNAPISGPGRRMMWYADKAAFRAGYVYGSGWDTDSIGIFSTGLGNNVVASNFGSTAIGFNAKAFGFSSTSIGFETRAVANYSMALGIGTNALQEYSTAIGYFNDAKGLASTATGAANKANALGSFTLGTYNDTTDSPDPLAVSPTDRIFQIGNGFGVTRSNAMTVLRNGYTGIGTTTPETVLHIKSSNSNPVVIDGGSSMWVTLAENGINRGYIGSYAGNPDDVELGTYGGSTGNVHLTTNNSPKLTVINNGNVGINTTAPSEKLEVSGNVKAGSYKYTSPKTYYYSVHPASFQTEFSTDKIYRDFSTVYYESPPNGTYMVAAINLPHGATITGFTVHFVDNSATEDIRIVLLYHLHSAGGTTELARVVSSGSPGSANLSAPSIGAPNVVNNQLANYAIEANAHSDNPWPGFNLQIRSVLITYTLSETQ